MSDKAPSSSWSTGRDAEGPASAGFLGVRRILVPQHVVNHLHEHLRAMGELGCEGVGFWAGVQSGDVFEVRTAVIPTQWSGRTTDGEAEGSDEAHGGGGLAVVISGDALFQMNVWLYEQRLTLIAQVHSHPGDAYHSGTDDLYAVLTCVGGLSIVVPDFATEPFSLERAAIYRLGQHGLWSQLAPRKAEALISIVD